MTEAADLLGPNKIVNDDGHNNLTPSTSNREKCKSPIPPDYTLLSERHYEAGPPEGTHMELVRRGGDNNEGGGTLVGVGDEETGDTFATTKEEEWVTKKKTEVTTTRQIETRVKRQVVLEDGKVVEDSGPIVTTNTTEDTEKQEHEQTERRTLGASDQDGAQDEVDGVIKSVNSANDKQLTNKNGDEWRVISVKDAPHLNGATVLKEVKEHRVLSREETEETRETEDIQHLGDITDEQYLNAVRSGNEDIRKALEQNRNTLAISTGPRIVHQSTKTHKTVDTEDKEEKSAVQPDGRIITETKRTTEHDETRDEELTDENASDVDIVNESSQRHHKTKDQEHIDYIADGVPIGREMRYTAETAEGERYGDPGMDEPDWDSLSTRIRKARRQQTSASRNQLFKQRGLDAPNSPIGSPLDRKDALTKRPIDFDQEEETRKEETSKWLEHHFGSDSRSSRDSLNEIDTPNTGPTTSYFNVTIKSKPTVKTQSNPPPPITPTTFITSSLSPKPYTPPTPEQNESKWTEWTEKRYEDHHQQKSVKDRHNIYRTKNHYGSADELESDSPKFYNGDSKRMNGHESPYPQGRNDEIPERDIHFKPIVDDQHQRSYKYKEREEFRRYPAGDETPPTVPQRRRQMERKQRSSEDSHYDSGYRSHSRNEMSYLSRDSKEELPFEEPPPDYSPPPRVTPSSSPSPPLHHLGGVKDKKLYQRTRFAADIPPPTSSSSTSPHQKSKNPSGNIIGQSIRKLVGKIRSASAERKAKQKAKRHMSRSPSPHQNSTSTYQQFNVIDNNIPPPVGLNESHQQRNSSRHYNEVGGAINDKPVSTTLYQKQKSNLSSSNSSNRHQLSDQSMAENRKHLNNVRNGVPSRGNSASPSVVQRYYLGEDPFGGSIYGRENKYDGVKPARSSRKYNNYPNRSHENGYYRRESPSEDEISRVHSSTLGRLSKSTSRLAPNEDIIDYSRNVQTLPRNIHQYNSSSTYKTNTLSHSPPTRLSKTNNNANNSTINVSIINTVSPPGSTISANRPLVNGGPAKPARTYKSTLNRSKSFNVHGGVGAPNVDSGPASMLNLQRNNMSTIYKSNPHLHRLDENPLQLKSPGIVSSISRSQRDINEAIIEEDRKDNMTYTPNRFSRNNNYVDDKKKIFMKGLADTAPELFKTLHANEEEQKTYYTSNGNAPKRIEHYRTISPKVTDNYRNNFINTSSTTIRNDSGYISPISKIESNYPVKHSTLRRGSNGSDNYSETYHITSKSDDPNHPSVTDTVKSFTKKTVPSKDGKSLETIESTETKTITKSRFRGNEPNLKYIENGHNKLGHTTSHNGGVVIEVRNNNYRK
ncbi:putative uncharacterized protein DDB_G0291812 isoform X2 [Chrysoperla carnea]|uniref:putative uncharacterized protein DDB_G0291812 isoform X2 n=1 Tax=Chrysoperla carnea TaxID=189513 RepID=UPI001D065DB7|nr:putative uncharacterized protein DDB_G0291812 isoform X2 [Chrysoperla carnea]